MGNENASYKDFIAKAGEQIAAKGKIEDENRRLKEESDVLMGKITSLTRANNSGELEKLESSNNVLQRKIDELQAASNSAGKNIVAASNISNTTVERGNH